MPAPSADDNPAAPAGSLLDRLRAVALFAVLLGAAGSVGFTLFAGQKSPRFLLALFILWVLSPFTALAWAGLISKRWSVSLRATLYALMLVITLGSLAVYADDARAHRMPQAAFVYVAVPPASWLLLVTALPAAAFLSGRRSRHHR